MNEHEQGYGVIKDVKQAKEAAKQALQDGLGGWFPAACVVLAKALDDAEKRAAPQAEPSDEEIDAIAASMPDGAGGMLKQWGYRQFARALLARYATRIRNQALEDAAQHILDNIDDGTSGYAKLVRGNAAYEIRALKSVSKE